VRSGLDFQIRFQDGRGLIGLREPARLAIADVARLELEVPQLRFPFDVAGGVARFATRRCLLHGLELTLDDAQLAAHLRRQPLDRFGLAEVRARITPQGIVVAGQARVGERTASFTARLKPRTARRGVIIAVQDLRVYSFLPAPAPLIGVGLALGLGATASDEKVALPGPASLMLLGAPALKLVGVDRIELDPVELALVGMLPRAGWRLPRTDGAGLIDVQLEAGRVTATFKTGRTPAEDDNPLGAGDALLTHGDLDGALAAWAEAKTTTRPQAIAALERKVAVLASLPARAPEALAAIERLRTDGDEGAHRRADLYEAALFAEDGRHLAAAESYRRAARLAEAAGETEDAIEAGLRAAEETARGGGEVEVAWLERVLGERPTHTRAAELLADAYARLGRWRPLVQLERRRLTLADTRETQIAGRVRVAELWLERLDDPKQALEELEKLLELDDGHSRGLLLYGRTLEKLGRSADAADALRRSAMLTVASVEAAEALLHAARLAAPPETALGLVEQALQRAPTYLPALAEVAGLLVKLGRVDDAAQAYQRAIAAAPDDAARAPLYHALALLHRDQLSDRAGARTYVERALAATTTPALLELAVELADADGRKDDLEDLLARLDALGDRRAGLRRCRLLIDLQRWADAADAAERVGRGSAEALAVLVEARSHLGDETRFREALERQVAVTGDNAARLRLGRLYADAGDLGRARQILQESLAGADASPAGVAARREALELLCDVLLRQGDDAALEVALGRLARARPIDDPEGRARALAAQGAARARLGLTAEAADSFQMALALDDEDLNARAGLGEAAFALRRWNDARAALEPLHERGLPPRVERALRLGDISERQQDLPAAIAFYQTALEAGASGGDCVRAWNGLAALYRQRQDVEAEIRALSDAAEDERSGESPTARAARLVAAADLLRKRAGRQPEAVELYERALHLDQLQLAALDALEAMAEADQDWPRKEQILARKVAATQRRPQQQKAILARLARLQIDLGRPDAAREAYTRALEIDADLREAHRFLADDARSRSDVAGEIAELSRLVSLPPPVDESDPRPGDLVRLGQLFLDADRFDEAAGAGRRSLELAPRLPAALAFLDDVYTRAGQPEPLAEVLLERAATTHTVDVAAELLLRRAGLLETLGRRADAVAAYEELTARAPSTAGGAPWTRLVALLRAEGDWARLADTLARQGERLAADGLRDRAEAALVEAAHLCHDRLTRPDRARQLLVRAREIQPRSRLALAGLLQLARATNDAAEEDLLLGQITELADTPQARMQAAGERARARQARGDIAGAQALIDDLPRHELPDAVLRLRIELDESSRPSPDGATKGENRPTPGGAAALEVLRTRALESGDGAGERWATRRLARRALEAGPTASAEALLRRAVELDPDDREAARALAQLERARGDDAALLSTLESLLRSARRTFEGAAREAELLTEAAAVLQRLGRADEARARLDEALALDAGPTTRATALRRLGLLHAAAGRHQEAAKALGSAAETPGALDADAWATLAEARAATGDAAGAADAATKAEATLPPGRRAALLESAGDEVGAARAWAQVGGDEGRRQRARLGRRRAARALEAGDVTELRAAATDVLALDSNDDEALGWALAGLDPNVATAFLDELLQPLAPADASNLLRRVAARQEAAGAIVDARATLERAAHLVPDAATLTALAEHHPPSDAMHLYRQALRENPAYAPAALGLAKVGAADEAAWALATARDQSPDAAERASLGIALGMTMRDRLNEPGDAREAFRQAAADGEIGGRPDLLTEALRALAPLERAAGRITEAEGVLETLRTTGNASVGDITLLAELYAEGGAFDRAIEVLAPLGAPSPLYQRCLDGAGRYTELLNLLETQVEGTTPDDARMLLMRAADVAATRLNDPAHAAALLERAVPLGPSDAELWMRIAALYAGPLGDGDRAARAWARAHAADPHRSDMLLPLADFHFERGELEPAADYYKKALDANAVPVALLARVYDALASDARLRSDAMVEEEALLAARRYGAGPGALTRLADIYRTRGDDTRLAMILQALLAEPQTAEAPPRLKLLEELGALLPPEQRLPVDEALLAARPDDDEARRRLLVALRAANQPARLAERLEEEIERATTQEARAAFALELADTAAQLGEHERSQHALGVALANRPDAATARGMLEAGRRAGRLAEAADTIASAALADPSQRDLLALAVEAHLQPDIPPARALALFEKLRAAGLPFTVDGALELTLLRADNRHVELLAALDQHAIMARDENARLALELEAAQLCDTPLGRPEEAARRFANLSDRYPERRDFANRARELFARAGEPLHALSALAKEMKLAGPDEQPSLKIVRGELLMAAGAHAEAEAEFLHALITTPRVGRAHRRP
jgi:tetratricopeptide (TPR) repeat protein